MYKITYQVWIGGKEQKAITSISIKKSATTLTDTCIISMPLLVNNKKVASIKSIQRGQEVSVYLGYDGRNNLEFLGYVKAVREVDNGVEIDCEDSLFLFRSVPMDDAEYKNISAKELIKKSIDAVNDSEYSRFFIDAEINIDYKYSKFTCKTASAYDVIEKIHKETKARFYFNEMQTRLIVCPQYLEEGAGEVKYSMSKNIDKDGMSLEWVGNDAPLIVEVEGTATIDGKTQKTTATAGKIGGDRIVEKIKGITDLATLQSIADDMYKARTQEGYRGSFQSWLRPLVWVGDTAVIEEDAEMRGGKYYIKSVETSVSSSGGIRKIELGQKIK